MTREKITNKKIGGKLYGVKFWEWRVLVRQSLDDRRFAIVHLTTLRETGNWGISLHRILATMIAVASEHEWLVRIWEMSLITIIRYRSLTPVTLLVVSVVVASFADQPHNVIGECNSIQYDLKWKNTNGTTVTLKSIVGKEENRWGLCPVYTIQQTWSTHEARIKQAWWNQTVQT